MARALDSKPESSNARADFYARIGEHSMTPLWEVLHQLLTHEPVTEASPHLWRYEAVRPLVMEGAGIISAEEAERRVLVLENPTLKGQSRITEALYAGLQLIMPGEVAPAHRHSPAALRFIVEGSGAYTAINGEKAYMEPGDLILTPSWVWHDHGHDGDVPVVWMDGLDIPLVRTLGPIFAEPYPDTAFPEGYPRGDNQARYGATMLPYGVQFDSQNSPVFHYPYAKARDTLAQLARSGELQPQHGIKMQYVNPANGGPVMPTIGTYLQLLPKAFETKPFQSTAAWVYSVVEGRGRAIIGDSVLEWQPKDVFVVPAWYPHRLEASEEAVLFSFTDKPVHEKLGLYRERNGAN